MKHQKIKIFPYFQAAALALSLVLLPAVAQAQPTDSSCEILRAQFKEAGKIDKVGDAIDSLPAYCTVGALLTRILNYGFIFADAIATLFVVIGGLQYMTSGGNEEAAKKGKKTLTYAVVGLVIVLLSVTGLRIVTALLGTTSGGNNPPAGGGPAGDGTAAGISFTAFPNPNNTLVLVTVTATQQQLSAACGNNPDDYIAEIVVSDNDGQLNESNPEFHSSPADQTKFTAVSTLNISQATGQVTTKVTVCGKTVSGSGSFSVGGGGGPALPLDKIVYSATLVSTRGQTSTPSGLKVTLTSDLDTLKAVCGGVGSFPAHITVGDSTGSKIAADPVFEFPYSDPSSKDKAKLDQKFTFMGITLDKNNVWTSVSVCGHEVKPPGPL